MISGFESPASWLTRVAFQQGVEFLELSEYLELSGSQDLDFDFTPQTVRRISAQLGLKPSVFEFAQRMLASIRTIDPRGEKYLLRRGANACYRYCPVCLARSREKTFPIHWRIITWWYCPLHRCLMQDACPQCGAPPVLPGSLMSAGADRCGFPLLDRCLCCGEQLTQNWKALTGSLDPKLLTPWEISMLKNGRAMLSALYWREVKVQGEDRRSTLNRLNDLHWTGALPGVQFGLTPSELERRREQIRAQKRLPLSNYDFTSNRK